jgi:hypothetical protein
MLSLFINGNRIDLTSGGGGGGGGNENYLSEIKIQIFNINETNKNLIEFAIDDDFLPFIFCDNVYTSEPHTINFLSNDSAIDYNQFITNIPYNSFLHPLGNINDTKKVRLFTGGNVNFVGKFAVIGIKKQFLTENLG